MCRWKATNVFKPKAISQLYNYQMCHVDVCDQLKSSFDSMAPLRDPPMRQQSTATFVLMLSEMLIDRFNRKRSFDDIGRNEAEQETDAGINLKHVPIHANEKRPTRSRCWVSAKLTA